MSKLSDIQYSLNGEKESSFTADPVMMAQSFVGDAPKFVVFKMVDTKGKGGIRLPGIADVINPKTKKRERARLLLGVDTIWQKEQKDLAPEYVKENLRNLHFIKGSRSIQVSEDDTTMLEFLRLSGYCIADPTKKTGQRFEFFEYDPAKQAKAALEKEMKEIEMAFKAKEMPEEKMRKHAAFLGIGFTDELGRPKTEEAIRAEYIINAKRNPARFEKTVDSKEVDIAFMIRTAIIDSKIDIGSQPGNIFWANGGGLISKLPHNRQAVEYLTELALTNTQEGRDFFEKIKSI